MRHIMSVSKIWWSLHIYNTSRHIVRRSVVWSIGEIVTELPYFRIDQFHCIVKKILVIAILLFTSGLVPHAQQLNIRKYTIEDGLVNNDVLNIYQDSQGFIWLCTRGGLSRYDGSRFTNYTLNNGLTNDMINDIYEIAPQQFIVAQNVNGPRLLKNGRLGPLKPGNNLVLNKFYSLNTRLLATTDYNGIVEWNNGEFRSVNPAYTKTVAGIAIVKDSLWFLYQEAVSAQLTTPSLIPWASVIPLDVNLTSGTHSAYIPPVA